MRNRRTIAFFFFAFLSVLIFWKFFFFGLVPFPGDYLRAWYEPWKTDTFRGVIGIAHKPVADDVFRHLYPLRILAFDLLKKFQLPLWNPYNGAGTPLLAIMHPGYLNPFGAVFFFLPPAISWAFFMALQPLILGVCTYLYMRKMKRSHTASLFSASVLLFSGFVIARILYGEFLYLLTALPILLLLIEEVLIHNKSFVWVLVSPIIFFLFLSGQPHMILYVLLFCAFYGTYRFFQVKPEYKTRKRIIVFCLLGILGVAMAAIQLVPSFELFANSTITRGSSQFIFRRFLLPLTHLITIAIPNYFGNQATYNWWGAGDYIETIASVGLMALFFAFIGVSQKRQKDDLRGFFFGSVIITVLLTLDWFGTRWLYSQPIPVLSADVPSRIFSLTTFSIAILAGYGFDAWFYEKRALRLSKVPWFLAGVALIFMVTAGLVILRFPCPVAEIPNCRMISLRNTLAEVAAFTVLVAALYVWRRNRFVPLVLVIVLGLYNSNKFLPFSSKNTILPDNSLIQALKENTRDARVFGIGSANVKTNFATYFRIYDPNYYDPLHIKRYAELIAYANSGEYPPKLLRSDIELVHDTVNNRILDLLSVRYLIYKKSEFPIKNTGNVIWEDKHWYIEKRNTALPRAYFVYDFEVIKDDYALLQRVLDPIFNPNNRVILEQRPKAEYSPGVGGEAMIEKYEEQRVEIKAVTDKPSLFVLTDTYYPGWKAYIDNRETPIYRANYTFRAVEVPGGAHTVRFTYEPMSVTVGGWITIGSLAVYGLIVLLITKPRATMGKNV